MDGPADSVRDFHSLFTQLLGSQFAVIYMPIYIYTYIDNTKPTSS